MTETAVESRDLTLDDFLIQIFLALKRQRVTFYDRHRDAKRDEPILDGVLAKLWRELDDWDVVNLRFIIVPDPMWGSSTTVENGLLFLRQIGILGYGHGSLAEYEVPDEHCAAAHSSATPLYWNPGQWNFYFGPEFWDAQAQRILAADRRQFGDVFW